jgi:hypothetical protein
MEQIGLMFISYFRARMPTRENYVINGNFSFAQK